MYPPKPFLIDLMRSTIAFFVIVDPTGTVPIIVGLTKSMDIAEKCRNFRIATYTGSALLVILACPVNSFMIAGGILLPPYESAF